MATYAELERELVWRQQAVAPNMDRWLIKPLRAFYSLGPTAIGSPGDNLHLRGRHRSRDWCLQSAYCTDRGYATRDARDLRGSGSWFRAVDVGITGQKLYDASRRMDALVRSGRDGGRVAEWFGTFDGVKVSGWYQGAPGSSNTSHLTHMHFGVWTENADDEDLMRLAHAAITGTDTEGEGDDMYALYDRNRVEATFGATQRIEAALAAIAKKVDIDPAELAAIENAAAAGVTAAIPAIVDALVARLPAGAMTRDDVEQAVRDAFSGGLAPEA